MIKLSDYVMKFLSDIQVNHVFMLSGGGCMHLVDSVGRAKNLKYECLLHEQAAALSAAAYAQYKNDLGVVLVTTGPGGTNAVTGVAAAWADSMPLLVISGQVKRKDISKNGCRMLGFQEVDIVSIVKPITKYAVTVMDPEDIKYHLQRAVYHAKTGRPGPVWIDIPLDVQAMAVDESLLRTFNPNDICEEVENNMDSKVAQTIELLNESNRPVIIAGYGVKLSNSVKKFQKLVKRLNIPVLTTWKAMDILAEDADCFYGRPGCIGQRAANFIQQNSDLVISLGARLDYGQIGYSHELFAREAKKVVVDIDDAEMDKFKFKVDLPINGDVGEFIDRFLIHINDAKKQSRDKWIKRCSEWKDRYPVVLDDYWNREKYVSTYALVDLLSKSTDENDVFAPGNSGACSEIFSQAFKVKEGQRIVSMNSLGAMGTGLPASIGACIASGKKRTICINGDGGFQMNIQDLETVARLDLPIKFFILNNDGYGSIKNMQRNYFNGFYVASNPDSGVTLPDTIKIANAYGINTMIVQNNTELKENIDIILSQSGPFICEVMVDPMEATMPKLTSMIKEDGTIVSKPLEDLWPFLDREEFKANMIVEPVKE